MFVLTEGGLGKLQVPHFPLATSYVEVAEALDAPPDEDHAYCTVVVDSVDWREPLIWAEASRRDGWPSIESPGFGKGDAEALTIWREYIDDAHRGALRLPRPRPSRRLADRQVLRPGRILPLFETGQLEEARLVRDLRATGAMLLEVDPETGRQARGEAHGGHFGGSLDAVALGLLEAPETLAHRRVQDASRQELRRTRRQGRRARQALARADAGVYVSYRIRDSSAWTNDAREEEAATC